MLRQYDNESNRYFVKHWRNIPESTVDAMEDFLLWLELDSNSPDISRENLTDIISLVYQFLGRDAEKLQQGEKELLQAWINSSRPD